MLMKTSRRFRLPRWRRRTVATTDPGGTLDAFAKSIDLRRLDEHQFVRLIEALDMLGEAGAGVRIGSLRTETLVWLIDNASRAQLERMMADPRLRGLMLGELFHRMSMHLDQDKARTVQIVVCWRFPDGSGENGYDRYQTVIENGGCVSGPELDRDPDATVTVAAADLLKLTTGGVSVPAMFLRGKIKIRGNIPIVANLITYFDIPRP